MGGASARSPLTPSFSSVSPGGPASTSRGASGRIRRSRDAGRTHSGGEVDDLTGRLPLQLGDDEWFDVVAQLPDEYVSELARAWA
jgi:hypothetical protein